jgi:hypothetical protein
MAETIGTRFGISMMPMEGDRVLKPLLHHEDYDEGQPQISPNGNWMAYMSNESGQQEVYVRSFPDVDLAMRQASTSGGACPLWSPNGREVFYLNNENYVMAAAVQTEPSLSVGIPKVLFKNAYLGISGSTIGNPWDIGPDGKRFLMMKPHASTDAAPAVTAPRPTISVVVNWLEELKQRVPAK